MKCEAHDTVRQSENYHFAIVIIMQPIKCKSGNMPERKTERKNEVSTRKLCMHLNHVNSCKLGVSV